MALSATSHVCLCARGQRVRVAAACTRHTAPVASTGAARFDPLGLCVHARRNGLPVRAAEQEYPASDSTTSATESVPPFSDNFCIIESRDAIKDFANMQLEEITTNIMSRRNRIFLLMEEVRRLRIQQRLKGGDMPREVELQQEKFVSALPFLPELTQATLSQYYTAYAAFFAVVILFGGLLAPALEVKLGLGGTSYLDFVQSLHLPQQLAQVDPIVASFCGGAVGVVSALLVVEVNNIRKQQRNRCHYCQGTGYLACGTCLGRARDAAAGAEETCPSCSGTGKVMCTSCLCTGKQMATEHDPRIDPFV